jgi:hypothetical protein
MAGHRGEITDHHHKFIARFSAADKRENAVFGIVGIDPGEGG